MAERPRRRRGRHDIIMQILKTGKGGEKKTQIMYKARLSYSQLEQYLNALKKAGFITEENDREGASRYRGLRDMPPSHKGSLGDRQVKTISRIEELVYGVSANQSLEVFLQSLLYEKACVNCIVTCPF